MPHLDFNPTPPSDGAIHLGLSTRRYKDLHAREVRADSVQAQTVRTTDMLVRNSVVNSGGILVKNLAYKKVTDPGPTAIYQGSLDDDSGNGYDLTVSGSVSFGTSPFPYIQIDTDSAYVVSPVIPELESKTRISAAMWLFIPSSGVQAARQMLFNIGPDSGGWRFCISYINDDLQLYTDYASSGDSSTRFRIGRSMQQDTWFHLAFTVDNVTVESYIDGVEFGVFADGISVSLEDRGGLASGSRVHLGDVPGGSWPNLVGLRYADVRVYPDHLLTAEEVSAIVAPNFTIIGDAKVTHTVKAAQAKFSRLDDAADDTAAETAGVPVDGLYHNSGAVRIRLT